MTSIHRRGVPPGGFHFPWGLLFKICCCGRRVGILIRCPNHWSCFILSWSLTVASPHSSRTSVLWHQSYRVRPRRSCRCLIWKVVSFRMSFCITGHVSAPYRRTSITIVLKTCTLVALLRFWLLKILRLSI